MKLLLTNDDGIDAAGLEALLIAARTLGDPVVVAPAGPQSGVSHRVTWHDGVRIEPRGERRYAIHGTPADCVRLGLLKVVPDAKWILSGINHGANLGADVHYSGTVAAVREAVLHGWPGIAISHYRKSKVESSIMLTCQIFRPTLSRRKSSGVRSTPIPSPLITATKKRAVSITPAIINCVIARPAPMSMFASAAASP
ncbi:MAG: 5'/3'-nucleotidase SurE [Verrucomicrobiaceae bacterium]|nr:5'/3'-nucleotidase SurE [Verrucomicrobiaceae bacterium]